MCNHLSICQPSDPQRISQLNEGRLPYQKPGVRACGPKHTPSFMVGMKAESFAMITFAPRSFDINISFSCLCSLMISYKYPIFPRQDHPMEVSGEFGCLQVAL